MLIANNDTFTGNQSGFGGGIFDDGPLIANNDTFTGNQAGGGGGIYVAEGQPHRRERHVHGESSGAGGGLYNDSVATAASTTSDTFYDSAATLTNDTFYDDSTTPSNEGDAIANQDSPITISNSILDESYSCIGSFRNQSRRRIQRGVRQHLRLWYKCRHQFDDQRGDRARQPTAPAGPETLAIDPTSSAYQEVPIGAAR